MIDLNPFISPLSATLKRSTALLVCACVAIGLVLSPNQSVAKPAKKPALSQKSKKQIVKTAHPRGAKASARNHLGKAAKVGRAGKGMKAKFGKQSFNRVKYFVPAAPSVGMMSGLHATPDPLALKSGVALVVDANTAHVLVEKNANTALPIASITKLMAALVVVESRQDLNEMLTISEADVQLEQRVRSRLTQGMEMSRRDALQLSLMSSENRAANMLSRHYPGGKQAFVDAMNTKAAQLGMRQSYFVEGTGLASANVASAHDLVKLVKAAQKHPLIRELSTQANYTLVDTSGRASHFHTTNRLIANPNWDIVLQKTGFINAAGQCLVMSANLDGRAVIMVFLDSAGKLSRLGDAQRVRDWLATNPMATLPAAAPKAAQLLQQAEPTQNNAIPKSPVSASHPVQQMMAWSPK